MKCNPDLSLVREIGVTYAAPRVDVMTLLAAIELDEAGPPRPPSASDAQLAALITVGLGVPSHVRLNRWQASALLEINVARRDKGLCTVKQAKLLRRHGLRDDLSMRDANAAIALIARNGWRVPSSMDPRFLP